MRLLLAEDEKSLSRALCVLLEKNNYSVDVVFDGVEAQEYLQTNNYDGAILDIMMPRLDGISVLRNIRKQGNEIPVIMLTAKAEVDDRVEGLDSGANDYLTKPFAAKELLARIRAMLRVGTGQQDTRFTAGNIILDSSIFELSTNYGSFRLARKEYQLMELFIRNYGKILSTEQLMDRIWGYDVDTEINVVWTYISYLRKKLGAIQADVEIKVRRNLGYVLEKKNVSKSSS